MNKTLIVMACVAMTLTSAGGAAAFQGSDEAALTKVGENAPAFEVTTLDGKKINSVQLKGKVVCICFMATWCQPCQSEMPHLEKDVWKALGEQEDFVLLVIGREHTKKELAEFKKTKGYTMPFAPDTDRKVFSKFAKEGIPRSYVIDRQGQIVFQASGFDPNQFPVMVQIIKGQLKQSKAKR